MLGGKCKDCKAPISIQYPLVELLTGFLGAGVIWLLPLTPEGSIDLALALPLFWMTITLVPIAAVDFPHQLIPDTVPIGGALIGIGVSFLPGGMEWYQSLLGGLIAGGGLFAFAWVMGKLLKKDALGFGDVKLLAALGTMMGWGNALAALIAASFLALLVMVPFRIIRKESQESPLAFGPFIGIMGPIMFLWGESLQGMYWRAMGL